MNRNYNFFRVDMRKMKTEALMIFTAHSLTKKKKNKKKKKKKNQKKKKQKVF